MTHTSAPVEIKPVLRHGGEKDNHLRAVAHQTAAERGRVLTQVTVNRDTTHAHSQQRGGDREHGLPPGKLQLRIADT